MSAVNFETRVVLHQCLTFSSKKRTFDLFVKKKKRRKKYE